MTTLTQLDADDLTELVESVKDGQQIELTIRVGEQTDTVTLEVYYTSPDAPEIGLCLPGDDRQYGKLMENWSGEQDTHVTLITRREDQHNADVLEVDAQ